MSRAKKADRPKRGRPRTVGNETSYLIKLPAQLDGLVRAAAKQDGVTLAEWWRAAACGALLLRAKERSAWVGLLERQGAAPLPSRAIRVTQQPGVSYRLPGDADPDEVTVPRGTRAGGGGSDGSGTY